VVNLVAKVAAAPVVKAAENPVAAVAPNTKKMVSSSL
jgi:hypothetical protein